MGKNTYEMQPVRVEAFHMTHERIKAFRASETDQSEWPFWLYEAWEKRPNQDGSITSFEEGLRIVTLEGVMKVSTGDWIIRGDRGELYPCRDDIFQRTYRKVD